jgi:hypothetical protein
VHSASTSQAARQKEQELLEHSPNSLIHFDSWHRPIVFQHGRLLLIYLSAALRAPNWNFSLLPGDENMIFAFCRVFPTPHHYPKFIYQDHSALEPARKIHIWCVVWCRDICLGERRERDIRRREWKTQALRRATQCTPKSAAARKFLRRKTAPIYIQIFSLYQSLYANASLCTLLAANGHEHHVQPFLLFCLPTSLVIPIPICRMKLHFYCLVASWDSADVALLRVCGASYCPYFMLIKW